jgi:hypothetical protein
MGSQERLHSRRSERSGAQDLSGPAGLSGGDRCGRESKLRAMTWLTEASALSTGQHPDPGRSRSGQDSRRSTSGDLRSAEGKPPTNGLSVPALMTSLLIYSSVIDVEVDRVIKAVCDVLT